MLTHRPDPAQAQGVGIGHCPTTLTGLDLVNESRLNVSTPTASSVKVVVNVILLQIGSSSRGQFWLSVRDRNGNLVHGFYLGAGRIRDGTGSGLTAHPTLALCALLGCP